MTDGELQEHIRAWVREYGPGGMPHERTSNFLQTLIDHKGFAAKGKGIRQITLNTIGDAVENAVCAMAATPALPGDENISFKAAMTLRAYYLTPKHLPEEERIRMLRGVGLPMGRHTYYRNVQLGRAFLMGYLMACEKAVA